MRPRPTVFGIQLDGGGKTTLSGFAAITLTGSKVSTTSINGTTTVGGVHTIPPSQNSAIPIGSVTMTTSMYGMWIGGIRRIPTGLCSIIPNGTRQCTNLADGSTLPSNKI